MGTLVIMHYPTTLFADRADHAYVKCGNDGKAWHCWGGNTGGTALREGPGSTLRADGIAEPDEKAGIKCYLVNGVCHQAANRIVLPAGMTVRGVRGYQVSNALFGTYGHVGVWPCRSPFNQCPGVTGDLPECVAAAATPSATEAVAPTPAHQVDWNYTRQVLAIYQAHAELFEQPAEGLLRQVGQYLHPVERVIRFHTTLFAHMIESQLGPHMAAPLQRPLQQIYVAHHRQRTEAQAEYAVGRVTAAQYAARFNELTLQFQKRVAEVTTDVEYEALFELTKNETVLLTDPSIVERMST